MQVLQGSLVALVTPMLPNGDVDYSCLENLIDWHIGQGTNGIVSVGTTGESATLNVKEHLDVIAFTVKHTNKRIPVIAGSGANSTREAIDLTKESKRLGADYALIVTPYYNKPNQNGLIAHYSAIADAVDIDQILYNVPSRTACDLLPSSVSVLSKHKNIIGIKEASCIIEQCMEIVYHKPEDFLLISGDDVQAVPIISIGGVGVMSVIANAFPQQFTSMIHHALAGDFTSASKELGKFLTIDPFLYEEGNPVGVKKLLENQGLFGAQVRMPLASASKELGNKLAQISSQEGLNK